ncbi:MAG: hypothetical protein IT200_11140 [Thermoleophilia bacterium]|nr:hypothetical protein [Thermoleophilia bacterium]
MRRSRRVAMLVAVAAWAPAAAAAPPPQAIEFPLGVPGGSPLVIAITVGADGNLWFGSQSGMLGRLTPVGGVTLFPLPPGAEVRGLTAGPDGNVWFADTGRSVVGHITPAGAITSFSQGITASARPESIVTGPDGNLWFTESSARRIGRITPGGTVTEFALGLSPGATPNGITAGPDGALWFTELEGRIGRVVTDGTITEFQQGVPADSRPTAITASGDGELWWVGELTDAVSRMSPAGIVAPPPGGLPVPGITSLAPGPDGAIWVTAGDAVGRIAGDVPTLFTAGIRPATQPWGIVQGPDGAMWFTQRAGNAVSRITTGIDLPADGNLLLNPGFEAGPAAGPGANRPVPGWATTGTFTAVPYSVGMGFPEPANSQAIGGGANAGAGGPGSAESRAIQHVDLTGRATAIDAGRVTATIAAHLGGFGSDTDAATVTATFRDAGWNALGSATIGPVTAADRQSQTGLLPRGRDAAVPAGTRYIQVTVIATRAPGAAYNDGYADNVSLTLRTAPVPAPAAPGPPAGTGAPGVTGLRLVPATVRAGRPVSVRFTASAAARLTVRVQRVLPGRRARAGCVAPRPALRGLRACTRYANVAAVPANAAAGANRVSLATRGRAPGRYRVRLQRGATVLAAAALRVIPARPAR